MSVASLNNGSLQLSELVISNEKYSKATGYVASSSTFSAGVTSTQLVTSGNISAKTFSTTSAGTSTFDNVTTIGNISAGGTVSADSFFTTTGGTSTFDIVSTAGNISAGGNVSAGGTVSADSFFTTTGGTSTFDIVTIGGILTCQDIVSTEGTLSIPTANITNNLGFIGASGNGSLTISADGSILYFNGAQIN